MPKPKSKQLPLPLGRPQVETVCLSKEAIPTLMQSMAALLLQVLEAEEEEGDDDHGS